MYRLLLLNYFASDFNSILPCSLIALWPDCLVACRNNVGPCHVTVHTKTATNFLLRFFSFSSLLHIEKLNRTCHDHRPEPPRRCVAFGLSRSFGSGEQFLDRKFASRWVLLSEGDEGGMSMTGYMLFCQLDFILVGCSINFIIHDF